MRVRLPLLWLTFALWAATALAQQTTLQLPTFSYFTTSTTVSVPDCGGVLLGGIGRARSGSSEFGVPILGQMPYAGPLFGSRSIGSERSAMSNWVTVQIHDFEAMDEALLGQPSSGRVAGLQPRAGAVAGSGHALQPRYPGAGSSWVLAPTATAAQPPTASVAQSRAQRAVEQATRQDEALNYFQRGQNAEAQGKPGVARIYYQMAARRATGKLKNQVLARLEVIGGARGASQVAQANR
jgi:type II secretory pathway component HofQ